MSISTHQSPIKLAYRFLLSFELIRARTSRYRANRNLAKVVVSMYFGHCADLRDRYKPSNYSADGMHRTDFAAELFCKAYGTPLGPYLAERYANTKNLGVSHSGVRDPSPPCERCIEQCHVREPGIV
jgi:hypothetical protein